MAFLVRSQVLQQGESQLSATAHATGMSFIDHQHCIVDMGLEPVAVSVALDIVQRNDRRRVVFKELFRLADLLFEVSNGTRRDTDGVDIKMFLEFRHPLGYQMRRAKNDKLGDFTTFVEFFHDKASFNRLTDTYVIGNQQADHRHF